MSSNGDRALDRISALAAILFDAPMSGIVMNGAHVSTQGPALSVPPAANVEIDHDPMTAPPYAHCRVYVPIARADGSPIGTLYVADTQARHITEKQVGGLVSLAAMAQNELLHRSVTQTAPHLLFVIDVASRSVSWLSDDRVALSIESEPRVAAALETLTCFDARTELELQTGGHWLHLDLRVTYCDALGRPSEVTGVIHDITKTKQTEARLAELVTTDDLTQVANKRGLNQRLQLLCAEAERGRRFAVTMVDLDHFKKINDTHGHGTGDAVLKAVAETLQQQLRKTDFVARFGGEEFCVIFTDVDGPNALVLAERLRVAIADCNAPVRVTASFGVALCSGPTQASQAELLEAADRALYRAKRGGRNRVAMARRIMPPASQKSTRAAA